MLPRVFAQGSSESFMPHGMCYLWEPNLVWLHVASDALTTLAYWAIPPFLIYLAVKVHQEDPSSSSASRTYLPYDWMFVAFGVFIVACGATHAMGIWTVWEPRYWLQGSIKAVTALASVATAVALPPLVPRALDLIREARESEVRRVELEEAHQEQKELVDQLREASEAKARFLANVSHDLRTPLSLILGPTEELVDRDLPPDVREQLEVVLRNARTLGGQVENLLTVTRMETGRLEPDPEPTELRSIVGKAAEHYGAHAAGRGIDFRLETPDPTVAPVDPDLLKRALLNLLSNAFKFTPDGGTVRCALGRTADGKVEIVVADSGPGIPEDERAYVFDRFRQGRHGTGRAEGGTGLGLAIVREVAEAHGGDLVLDRAPEGGARLTLRLPAGAGAETGLETDDGAEGGERLFDPGDHSGASTAHPANDPDGGTEGGSRDRPGESSHPTVLVVEDDADMARYLGRLLSDHYDVRFAADGRQGLRRAVELRPDLVLTDMMMPGMDGAELVESLREAPELTGTPILVLTARAGDEMPERMLRKGAQDYVVKPVGRGELLARVENLLELTGSRSLLQDALGAEEESLEELARMAASRKEQLERTVREKKVLMRELHHRVKGNLQTITSLLKLQLRTVEDEGARRSLEESRGRVATMGLLHEKLYRSGDPDRVEMSDYLRSLVADVVRSRGAEGTIRTRLTLEEMELPVEDAIAGGLIVHELVTNALRHAFPSGGSGTVQVSLHREGGEAVLAVADDGAGMPEGDGLPAETLGLQLVESLAGQLDGSVRIRTDEGTTVEVVFAVAEGEEARWRSPGPTGEDGP